MSKHIRLMSDLHIDHYVTGIYEQHPFQFGQDCPKEEFCDILIAGDLISHNSNFHIAEAFFEGLASNWIEGNKCFFLLGNHEYWGLSVEKAMDKFLALKEKFPFIHILKDFEPIEFAPQIILCGDTGWFELSDMVIHKATGNPHNKWCDFRYTIDLLPFLRERKKLLYEKLFSLFEDPKWKEYKIIVATHHPPFKQINDHNSCSSEYYYDNQFLKPFQLGKIEKQPFMWFFGHTHQKTETSKGDIEFYSYPRGYPDEYELFDSKDLLSINQETYYGNKIEIEE